LKLPTWLEAVLVVALVVALFSFWRSHEALRDALAQQDVLKHEKADLQERIESAGKAEKAANALLEAERKKPATVNTVTKFIPLPGPVEIRTDPGKPSELVIGGDPQKNLDALQNFGIECQECKNSLAARNSQFADLQKQLTLSEQNAENWKKAANKGSGFWARSKEWGIRVGFAAGGYAVARATK